MRNRLEIDRLSLQLPEDLSLQRLQTRRYEVVDEKGSARHGIATFRQTTVRHAM
jgi:hypothetical protein